MNINIWKASILSVLITAGILICSCSRKAEDTPKLGKASITDVVAAMTLEDKALMVCGTGMDIPPSLLANLPEGDNPFGALTGEKKEPDPEYDAMVRELKARRVDPYSAAEELLARMFDTG